MQHPGIPEQNEDSLSLHEHTVIQIYPNLDYSDECDHSDSSNAHSLSRSHHLQLRKMAQINKQADSFLFQQDQLHREKARKQQRGHLRPIRNIESKYDLGISPSTKEEQSILNANFNVQRKSNEHRQRVISQMPDIYSNSQASNEEEGRSHQGSRHEQQQERAKIQSGRQARLAKHRKQEFNINSFLNAQPVPLHPKKGLNVLNKSAKPQATKNHPKQQYANVRKETISEEDSITLITLPQLQMARQEQILSKIKHAENELSHINSNYDRRFKQARLSFIDNFMPSPLKIKSNAYNLLKYMVRPYK